MSVSAQLINSGQFRPQDITVFDPSKVHHYQPGYTNVAGGLWNSFYKRNLHKYLERDMKSTLNSDLTFVNSAVQSFEPEQS